MPKNSLPKLGNPRLDKKMPPNEMPAPRNQTEEDENLDYKVAFKRLALYELMDHFGIDPKDKNAWMWLSIALAEHYVPGMQFSEKKGQPKKWSWQACWTLHALYMVTKAGNPHANKKQIFNEIRKNVGQTKLCDVIDKDVAERTLEDKYNDFLKKPLFWALSEAFKIAIPAKEHNEYFKEVIKKQSTKALLQYHDDLQEAIKNDAYFHLIMYGTLNQSAKNYDALISNLKKMVANNPKYDDSVEEFLNSIPVV